MAHMRLEKSGVDLLKPIWRAYIFAYLSNSAPRILSLTIALLRGKTGVRDALRKATSTIQQSAGVDRFPACAALLVAGTTLGPRFLSQVLAFLSRSPNDFQFHAKRLEKKPSTKFIAAFLSALATFSLLNLRPSRILPATYSYVASEEHSFSSAQQRATKATRSRRSSSVTFGSTAPIDTTRIPPLAGRTMDLTTFGLVHASIVLASLALDHHKQVRPESRNFLFLTSNVRKFAAPSGFIVSCAIIMACWFYSPDRLPRSYNNWITSAAELDPRFLETLRQCRYGGFIYGKETGVAHLLGSMARELGMPEIWGDPAQTIPVPCELYHAGTGPNCEWHALSRFYQGFKFAFRMYLPLNLVMMLRRERAKRDTRFAITSAAQSSAFLGAFISLFYYGVCLGRTRIGPRVLGTDVVSRQMIDGGICVAFGCMTCGWSIMAEKEARRIEMSLFCLPRALSTLLPRRYDRQYMWREQLAFALSTATVLTAAQTKPDKVKGVFGGFLQQVLG